MKKEKKKKRERERVGELFSSKKKMGISNVSSILCHKINIVNDQRGLFSVDPN